jgi:palmitoyltransferase
LGAQVGFLLNPSPSLGVPRRTSAAITQLVIFYLLLTFVIVCYFRLFHTITTNPGFVPRGPQWHVQKAEKNLKTGKNIHHRRKSHGHKVIDEKDPRGTWLAHDDPVSHLREDEFWRKDIFICNYDGRPPFCSNCLNYKVDRVHHCSEVNRCVRKMDHFCPWVGGIISETSFKFFIQFTFYTALFTLFTLVVVAYYFSERRRVEAGFLNVHWVLVLAFAGLFFLFGIGMFASSFQLTWVNTTTVENLSKRTKVHYLAVYMPQAEKTLRRNEAAGNFNLRTITYPRPSEEQCEILQQHGADPVLPVMASPQSVVAGHTPTTPTGAPNSRTFAILQTTPGTNPWDCGSAFENISEVMGTRLVDWFLPIRYSPCANHDSPISMFKLNPKLEHLKRAAGIEDERITPASGDASRHGRRKKRRRRSQSLTALQNEDNDKDADGRRPPSRRHSSQRR